MVIRIFLLVIFLVPVLFVMTTIVSEAQTIGPFSVGICQQHLDGIVELADDIRGATEKLAVGEIDILRRLLKEMRMDAVTEVGQRLHDMKMQTERSV